MNIKLVLICLSSIFIFWQCKTLSSDTDRNSNPTISVVEENLIDCFEPAWDSTKNRWTFCEVSACLFLDHQLYMASDKEIPKHSSVFKFNLSNDLKIDTALTYIDLDPLKQAIKYEDFGLSPDRKRIFLTTSFDRIKSDNNSWDGYNTLLSWDKNNKPQVLNPEGNNGFVASVPIRKKISKALSNNDFPEGMPYFKIEGLAAMPKQKLLFGVREMGEKYDNFEYTILLLEAKYQIASDGLVKIDGDFKIVYEFKPQKKDYPTLRLPIALSSIEYDPLTDKIYMTTSFEQESSLGAYLWELTPKMLTKQVAPRLFHNKAKQPYCMTHKAEGLAIIDENHLFIVHDDDRELIDNRQPHQTAYTILKIE